MEGCTGFWVVGGVFWLTCVPVWGVLPSWLMSVWLTGRATRQPSLHGTHRGAVGSVSGLPSADRPAARCAHELAQVRSVGLLRPRSRFSQVERPLGGGNPDLGRERV